MGKQSKRKTKTRSSVNMSLVNEALLLGRQNNEYLKELRLVIGGSATLNIEGIISKQRRDEEFKIELQKQLQTLSKDFHDFKSLFTIAFSKPARRVYLVLAMAFFLAYIFFKYGFDALVIWIKKIFF